MATAVAEGVDYANERLTGAQLKAAGKKFVVRYTSPDTTNNPGKLVEQSEIDSFRAAGIEICLVWETSQTRATQGFSAGVEDAKKAEAVRKARGLSTMPLYFVAQDAGDVTGPQCVQYFKGVASVLGLARIGGYGGFAVIKYLFDRKLITYGWQTYAWSGGQWDPRAQLQQYHNGVKVAGQTVDLCRAMQADFGQFTPGGSTPVVEEDTLSDAQVQTIVDAINTQTGKISDLVWHHSEFTPKPDATGKMVYSESAAAQFGTVQNQIAGLGSQIAGLMTAIQTVAAGLTELKEQVASISASTPVSPADALAAVTQVLPQVRLTVPTATP